MPVSRIAAAAGAVAVVASIGIGELLAGLVASVPSPVDAIGQALIPRFPGAVTTWAIATFGSANRAVLLSSIVVVALLIGAAAGVLARATPGLPVVLFVLAGGFGVVASLNQPGASFVPVLLAIAAAVAVGIAVLRASTRYLDDPGRPPPAGEDGVGTVSRRRVLVSLGGVAIASVAVGSFGRWGTADRVRTAPAEVSLPPPGETGPTITSAIDASTEIDGLSPILTPTDRFFRIDTALSVPRVDPDTWRLRITGMVDQELEFTLDQLLDEPFDEVDATIACVSNEVGGDLIGTARWLGTPLVDLLERAGIEPGATQIVGRSVDGWTAGFPTELALQQREAIIAVGMNGEQLPERHGFPARLIIPGLFGYVSATKWLTEIELTTWEGFDGYWVPRGWSKEGPIKTASRIDVPRARERVSAGDVVVAGVAWAPTRGISDVEVDVDGEGFRAADLVMPLADTTWIQWRTTISLDEGEHELTVRAVDGDGQRQPEGPAPPAPDGSEGWHRRTVSVAS